MIFSKKGRTAKDDQIPEKEPQYYRSLTGETVLNYHVYYMKPLEKVAYFLLAFAVGAAVGYLFYGGIGKDQFGNPTRLTYILNTIIMVLCGCIAGKLFVPIRTAQIQANMQKKLKTQFRDMLESLITAFGAGKNVTDAFVTVQNDMANQYEETAYIVKEIASINGGVMNGFNIEEMMKDFGKRSGLEDIENFADIFEICYRQGGDIRETVRNSCVIIGDKMAVAEDIETTVSGSKNEQYIMLVMPVVLIGLIKSSSPEFGANFATLPGLIATTIGIVLFAASYFVGKKLLAIKV